VSAPISHIKPNFDWLHSVWIAIVKHLFYWLKPLHKPQHYCQADTTEIADTLGSYGILIPSESLMYVSLMNESGSYTWANGETLSEYNYQNWGTYSGKQQPDSSFGPCVGVLINQTNALRWQSIHCEVSQNWALCDLWVPTHSPTISPTTPTRVPSKGPTNEPSKGPTNEPSKSQTRRPSKSPIFLPSKNPTFLPTPTPVNEMASTSTTSNEGNNSSKGHKFKWYYILIIVLGFLLCCIVLLLIAYGQRKKKRRKICNWW